MVLNSFDLNTYYYHLKTKTYGRPCIYLDKTDSTIDVALNQSTNSIVLAREQLKGRGQRSNIWLSPPGCAMGSLKIAIKRISPLANRLCFLQHMMGLAIANTLERLDEKKLGKAHIKLKWPNDIVYQRSENGNEFSKLGGILVNSKQLGDLYDIVLSFGLNVFNRNPTTCLSDILGSSHILSIEFIVANFINNFEKLTTNFDDELFDQIKNDYISRCIQINKLIEDEINGEVLVRQVSDEGYLIGERSSDRMQCVITKII